MNATDAAPLLAFCEFLSHRVHTQHLDALKVIITEFLAVPQSIKTLDGVLQCAFPSIVILPIAKDAPPDLEMARSILQRMKSTYGGRVTPLLLKPMDDLTELLSAQVILNNWDWLERIFEDFCAGTEDCLQQFLALHHQAIAFLPVPPLIVTAPTTVLPAKRKLETATGESDRASRQPTNKPASHQRGMKNYESVRKLLHEIEKKKPWETIWDPSDIQYPFDAAQHPDLAHKMKRFWNNHTYAVWERNFWLRLPAQYDSSDFQDQRKIRQDNAARWFENLVITPVYQTFGTQFFVDLDGQTPRHHWWWYRKPVIDLITLSANEDLDQCLAYIRQNCFTRFPNRPRGCELHRTKVAPVSASMWSVLKKYVAIRREIEQLKQKQKQLKKHAQVARRALNASD